MTISITAAMREAAALTRAGKLADATRLIRETLAGPDAPSAGSHPGPAGDRVGGPVLDLEATTVDRPRRRTAEASAEPRPAPEPAPEPRVRRPLPEVLRTLAAARAGQGPVLRKRSARPTVASGADYVSAEFASAAGSRPYRLYRPASLAGGPAQGLVVMLHGCKQDPDDFAAGTGMNEWAERHRLVVAYPGQVQSANPASCWNWFDPAHQRRDGGEPAILAELARTIAADHGVPQDRVFVAGLSAGGAMAAVLAESYPDVFAAAAVHSGLAAGSANDVVSAFATMRGETPARRSRRPARPGRAPRLIVFQGTADTTVHPSNAERIVEGHAAAGAAAVEERGRSAGGRPFARAVRRDRDGAAALEVWTIEGAGHAWSGGHPSGSYTDPKGPDATAEALRFFLDPQA